MSNDEARSSAGLGISCFVILFVIRAPSFVISLLAMYSPTLEEFRKLATQGNLIPVTRRLLADFETPLSAYRKIRGEGEPFRFESVEGGEHLGRYSFVGCNPRGIVRQRGQRLDYLENGNLEQGVVTSREGTP